MFFKRLQIHKIAVNVHNPEDGGSCPPLATKKALKNEGFFNAQRKMEFVVYILYSKKHDTFYKGYTTSLIAPFKSHNSVTTRGYKMKNINVAKQTLKLTYLP